MKVDGYLWIKEKVGGYEPTPPGDLEGFTESEEKIVVILFLANVNH